MSPAPIATSDFRPVTLDAFANARAALAALRHELLDEVLTPDDDNDLAHQAEALRIAYEVDRFAKWLAARGD